MTGIFTLPRKKLHDAISSLLDEYRVVAPIKENGSTFYKEVTSENMHNIDLVDRPLNTPKHFLYPNEIIFRYKIGKNDVDIEENLEDKKMILFGIKPCDMRSIEFLDRIFTTDYEDIYYTSKRDNTILVSIDCTSPMESCFCTEMGIKKFTEKFDLNLSLIGDNIIINPNEKGREVVEKLMPMLQRGDESLSNHIKKLRLKNEEPPKLKHPIKEMVEQTSDEEWKRLGSGCLQCGSCAFACPECYCFTFIDKLTDENRGGKIRLGASCMMESFTQLALGANSRKEQSERAKQRYMHKFVYLPETIDMLGCVGCGRCVEICPAGIDIKDVLQRLDKSIP
jgi:ferredoxin